MNKNLVAFTVCLIFLSVLISWSVVQFANPSYLYLIVGVLASIVTGITVTRVFVDLASLLGLDAAITRVAVGGRPASERA